MTVRTRARSDPLLDFTGRPSNSSRTDPVRLGKLACTHQPVNRRSTEPNPLFDVSACKLSIRRVVPIHTVYGADVRSLCQAADLVFFLTINR